MHTRFGHWAAGIKEAAAAVSGVHAAFTALMCATRSRMRSERGRKEHAKSLG